MKNFPALVILIYGLLLVACSCRLATPAGPDQNTACFDVLGPGGGGGVLKPTVSPFNPNLVITHCDMTETYVSHDGGQSWKNKNLYNVPEDIEFDPLDSNVVYIATKGFSYSEDRGSGISMLLRSTDRGESWHIIYPELARSNPVLIPQSTNLLPSAIIPGTFNGSIQKIRVDPSDSRTLYLGMTPLIDYMSGGTKTPDTTTARLLVSKDRGMSWSVAACLPGKQVKGIFPGKDVVLVFTERAGIRMQVSSGSITEIALPAGSINEVDGTCASGSQQLYLQTDFRIANGKIEGGMFTSTDLGISWNACNRGLLENLARGRVPALRQGLAICQSRPEVAYISIVNPENDGSGQTVDIYCIFKTTDGGQNWIPVLRSSSPGGYLTHNYKGSWMEASFDPGWGGSPIDLGVAPGNPDVCYAGDNGRGYKTTDGGKTWQQIYSHNNTDGTYSNTGLNVTTCYGVHFDPFDSLHFFICYTDIGLFHTHDGGRSWKHSITGVPGNWQNTCYALAFDPEIKDRLWSVWADAHDLPRTKMFGPQGFAFYSGGVARSDDGGKTWIKSNSGISENSVCTHILIDPHSPVNSRTLYTTVFGKGVYKSLDGGNHWKPVNQGMGTNRFAWQLRMNAEGRLFMLAPRGSDKGKPVDGAIYYSDTQGDSWINMPLPDSVNGPHDLLIDPLHPEIMYLSCWPRLAGWQDKFGGLWKTRDGGKTWFQVFDDRFRVNSAGMDPVNQEVLYINTFQNAAFKSTDGGKHWNRIGGYRFKWGQRAIPDPRHPGKLFLTTYGGSVFYGPSDGIPGKADDIDNMPDGWW
jgi:photosystem II stability/assembly factor-like uncharacterized protein